jgi:hypothetical protein
MTSVTVAKTTTVEMPSTSPEENPISNP